jgi:hypothetical protein
MIGADIMSSILLHSADWPEELRVKVGRLHGEWSEADEENQEWILNEDMWDLLNEWAPENCYFGSSMGNGSDFGFWEIDEEPGG